MAIVALFLQGMLRSHNITAICILTVLIKKDQAVREQFCTGLAFLVGVPLPKQYFPACYVAHECLNAIYYIKPPYERKHAIFTSLNRPVTRLRNCFTCSLNIMQMLFVVTVHKFCNSAKGIFISLCY